MTIVACDVEAEAIGINAVEFAPHQLEVGEASRGEVIALCRLDIDLVECREIVVVTAGDFDACLLCLADVATPELVEAGEDIVECAIREIDLEHIARLHIAKARSVGDFLHPISRAQGINR